MSDVYLYIYDLTLGLAKKLIKDKSIEGIWHTSIVAFGEEYFYALNGFNTQKPSSTPLGEPNEKILLGTFDLSKEEFLEIINEQIRKGSYVLGEYNLFTHNCNCFSNDLAMRLFNEQIPEYIRDMPLEAVTDLMQKPVIGKLFKSVYKKLTATQTDESQNMSLTLENHSDSKLLDFVKEHLDNKQIRYLVSDE